MLLLGVAGYLVVGIAVNVGAGKPLGVESLPHLEFWTTRLPAYVRDGLRMAQALVGGRGRPVVAAGVPGAGSTNAGQFGSIKDDETDMI